MRNRKLVFFLCLFFFFFSPLLNTHILICVCHSPGHSLGHSEISDFHLVTSKFFLLLDNICTSHCGKQSSRAWKRDSVALDLAKVAEHKVLKVHIKFINHYKFVFAKFPVCHGGQLRKTITIMVGAVTSSSSSWPLKKDVLDHLR